MAHFVNILFFVMVMLGAMAVMLLTLRQYWDEILAALVGEIPVRQAHRPWVARVRVKERPRPQVARAARRRAAA